MNWFTAATMALLSFGFWGLFTKLSVVYINSKSALIYQTIGVVIVSVITLFVIKFKPETDAKGIGFALLTGIAYAVGCWFYFIAASRGKIITVVTMTALYPFVTILLATILLKESVSAKQGLGIALAFIAIVLMAT